MEYDRVLKSFQRESITNKKTAREYYLSEEYEVYFIEYIGDIKSSIEKVPFADIYLTERFFSLLFVENGRLNEVLKAVPEITNLQKGFPYILSEMRLSNNLYSDKVLDKKPTSFQGEGIVIGIISTGIDYLNPRFIKNDGSSRVVSIWDQSLEAGPIPNNFIFGTEFTQEEINEALKGKSLGQDPYSIVNHKDEIGHGTALAALIGGRDIEVGDPLNSVIPKCDFAIVKLKEAKNNMLRLSGVDRRDIPIYQDSDLAAAVRYLAELQIKLDRPMVVYLALGSNSGGKNGQTVLERYINYYSQKRDFTIVCNTGNQGNASGHASGSFNKSGEERVVPINVDLTEGNLFFSIYTFKPDRISVGIGSPTGDGVTAIVVPKVNGESSTFNLGSSTVTVQYFQDFEGVSDERIDVLIKNAVGGSWVVSLLGEYIVKGKYDMWLLPKELLKSETRFLEANPNTTLMTPSSARNALVTSYYNQENNSVVLESGRGFTRDGGIKPSVSLPGVDILTVGLDNAPIVATGAAMAGALLTGAVGIIYEWGILRGNDIDLFPPKLRSYIISATLKEQGEIYPNEVWGYGRFSFNKLLENLQGLSKNSERHKERRLYINIPLEIYERLGI